MTYDESDDPETNAAAIQTALQGLGGVLADVTVEVVDAKNYLVKFGDVSAGEAQPLLYVDAFNFTSGFLAAVDVSMVREPGMTVSIPISDNPTLTPEQNWAQTAQNIEYAFSYTSDDYPVAPVQFPPQSEIASGPYYQPITVRTAMPAVKVTMHSATRFDVTFTGDAGKQQQPLLKVLDSSSAPGSPVPLAGATATILKQSSDQFRVNDPEPQDPGTLRPQFYDQSRPQVAMDADGDFVITWQSVIPDSQNPNSLSDIFARRFSPSSYETSWENVPVTSLPSTAFVADMNHDGTIDNSDNLIQNVRSMGDQFQVNSITTNAQAWASVGMDTAGNFTIAWQSTAQGLSFFNTISAQRFDHAGNRLGNEFTVNAPDNTTVSLWPYVAMSDDGLVAVTWTNTSDVNYLYNQGYVAAVLAQVYDPQGTALANGSLSVGGGGYSTAGFDLAGNLAIAWEVAGSDPDNVGTSSVGCLVQEYDFTAANAYSGAVIRSTFRPNSASFDTGANADWPYTQIFPQVVMDADGDLTVSYEGYAPDVSENVSSALRASPAK